MDVTYLLILLLLGAFATYFSGDKLAPKVALFFGLASFGLSVYLLTLFNAGENINFLSAWIRTFGAFSPIIDSAYKVQLFGQIFAAIGQPLLLNAPPRYQSPANIHQIKKLSSRHEPSLYDY